MGRWDPKPLPGDRADDDPVRAEDIDDVDDPGETIAHAQQQLARVDAQLRSQPPTDPALLERLQRERAYWRRVVDTTVLDGHWDSGAGDRTLF